MGQGTILRADDLVVLGVSWSQMEPVPPALEETGAPELVAAGDRARLVVTFPPQAVAERPVDWSWWGSTWTDLGGSAPPGARAEALCYRMGRIDLFYVGDDGVCYANPWVDGVWASDAGGPIPVGGAVFPPGALVTAVSDGTTLDAFAVDINGIICRLVVGADGAFSGWFALDGGSGEGSGFEPGMHVGATVVLGILNVFAPRNGELVHWRADLGFRILWSAPFGARLHTYSGDPWSLVYWVDHDGQLVVNIISAEGALLRSQPLGSTSLRADSPIVTTGETGFQSLFAVTGDGVLWGVNLQATTFTDELPGFVINQWAQLATGFVRNANVSAMRIGPELTTVAVDGLGIARAVVSRLVGRELAFSHEVELGDWFPPGSPVSLTLQGPTVELAAITADRTVRHTGRTAAGSWLGPPTDWQPLGRIGRQPANLSGPTRVAFHVPRGERVVLTAQGVLEAMRHLRVAPWPAAGEPEPGDDTLMEVPWGMHVSPTPGSITGASHRVTAAASASGATDVWHTRLAPAPESPDAATGRVSMRAVRPTRPDPSPEFGESFVPVLDAVERERIVQASASGPFSAERLMLSPIGGWVTVDGSWPSIDWAHDLAGGRDKAVRTVVRGVLFPFGHEAVYDEVAKRRFDPRSGLSVAVLHRQATLHVRDPVRHFAGDEQARVFPFGEAEVATPFVRVDPAAWTPTEPGVTLAQYRFQPHFGGQPLLFPVVLRNAGGEVTLRLPLLFVWDAALASEAFGSTLLPELEALYGTSAAAPVKPTPVALAGEQPFEVHELHVGVRAAGGPGGLAGFLPRIAGARVGLPAVRELAKEVQSYRVAFSEAYVQTGLPERVFDVVEGEIGVDFAGVADRVGGLATPSFAADAISAAGAPVKAAMAAAGSFDPSTFFSDGARLLGILDLRTIVDAAANDVAPVIRTITDGPPTATLEWKSVKLGSVPPLRPIEGRESFLNLTVEAKPPTHGGTAPHVRTTGWLTDFCLDLAGVLVVSFRELRFTSVTNEKPKLAVSGLDVQFAGDLQFLAVLQDVVESLAPDLPVAVEATPAGVRANHHIALPPLTLPAGIFSVSVQDAVFDVTVDLPFEGNVGVDLAFGSRRHPFRIGVWILAGGGYLELKIRNGEPELTAAAEIGGMWAIDWVVVTGEVHALAGIEIRIGPGGAVLTGYLRLGGSVELLGIVSVSIELSAAITTTLDPFKVVASARVVLEVDLFLTSAGVDFEKTIVIYDSATPAMDVRPGPGAARELPEDEARTAWERYRAAFEPA